MDQCSTSFNARAGTLRGLHYQAAPHGEAKLVRCTRGAIYDVAVDLRPDSPSYLRWFGVELSADNGRALFVPEGCAHGFQTLVDASEVLYQISTPYVPDAARGVRWDDPAFGIEWPPAPPGGAHDVPARRRVSRLRSVSRVLLTGATGFIGRHALAPLRGGGPRGARRHDAGAAAGRTIGVTWHRADLLASADVVAEVAPEVLAPPRVVRGAGPLLDRAGERPLGGGVAGAAARLRRRGRPPRGGRRHVRRVRLGRGRASAATSSARRCGRPRCTERPSTRSTRVAARYAEQAGFELAWGRIFFVYGPGEPDGRLVPSVGRALLAGEPVPTTRGDQVRDFMHVEDVAAAFAALADGDVTGAVNVASGEPVTVREVVDTLAAAAGRPDLPRPGALPDREGDPPRLVADVSRLRDEVGFAPRIGLPEGLERDARNGCESRMAPPRECRTRARVTTRTSVRTCSMRFRAPLGGSARCRLRRRRATVPGLNAAGASEVVGIEIVPERPPRIAASVMDRVIVRLGRDQPMTGSTAAFDTILCLDVLEHLVDPAEVLCGGFVRHASPEGATCRCRCPNARHYSLRARPALPTATFGYSDWGHRDSTHLAVVHPARHRGSRTSDAGWQPTGDVLAADWVARLFSIA